MMISSDFGRRLFAKEFEVLETALAQVAAGRFEGNDLSSDYQALLDQYSQLLNLTRKVFKISDSQSSVLAHREQEFKHLLDHVGQGIFTFGSDLVVNREYSAECVKIFGRKIGKLNVVSMLTSDNEMHNKRFADGLPAIWQTLDANQRQTCLDDLPRMICCQGKHLSLDFKLIPRDGSEQDTMVMVIATDVTDQRLAQEQIAYLSYHDKLTSLYNRAYVEAMIPTLQGQEHFPVSVIMADMNGLKLTNDVFGHAEGDRLLVKLAQVLSRGLRRHDIVARWGGDEFVIILPTTDAKGCQWVSQRIEQACKNVEGLPIELSVALGSATQQSLETHILDLFSLAENRMYTQKLHTSKQVRSKLVAALEETLHTKCYEDPGHTKRTQELALRFARYLKLGSDALHANLSMLASLHDIGKVAIPKEILGKRGTLTDEEWDIIRSHSEIGYRMAQSLGEAAVAEAILAFHERWDGQGYPTGLKSEEIPLAARLMSIVDVYDVMTHDRPYRSVSAPVEAMEEIRLNGGKQFDPHLADQFVTWMRTVNPSHSERSEESSS